MQVGAGSKNRFGIEPDIVPVWQIQPVPEPRPDICEFLLVDRNNPGVFYCGLTGDQIDVAFKPCLLPLEERLHLCPDYQKRYADKPLTSH
jgi:hypothetical protein